MILVMLGTQKNDFSRLLKEIEKCIEDKTIQEPVIVQAGSTNYKTDKMQIFDLMAREELDQKKQEASLIITHGGVGSIVGALKMNKKVIAVPRLKQYRRTCKWPPKTNSRKLSQPRLYKRNIWNLKPRKRNKKHK